MQDRGWSRQDNWRGWDQGVWVIFIRERPGKPLKLAAWTGFELGFRQVGDSWCHFFWHVYTYWFFSELVSNVFSNLLKLTLKPRGTPCVLQQQSLEAWGDLEATNQNQVEQPLVKNISRYTLAMLWWITKYLSFLLSQDFGSCFTRSSRNIHEALK